MFEYFLAGFTGTFFSYFVIFQFGACTEYLFHYNKEKQYMIDKNNLEYIKIKLEETSNNVKKIMKKMENTER
jgi:hypothetical protein